MRNASPEEVIQALKDDLERMNMTQTEIASFAGYKNRQSIAKLLSSYQYLTKSQAVRFKAAFGYSVDFLTEGIGTLFSTDMNRTVVPKSVDAWSNILKKIPTPASEDGFYQAIVSFIDSACEIYGPDFVAGFFAGCSRFINITLSRDKEANAAASEFFKGWKEPVGPGSVNYHKFMTLKMDQVLQMMYGDYMKAVEDNHLYNR